MEHKSLDHELVERMRRLVASEPKNARSEFMEILASHPERLEILLEAASSPGEGRLRQMIATTARLNPDERLTPWLKRWISVEADEFTRVAIESAIGQKVSPKRTQSKAKSLPLHFIEAYRYVADRLCHRVRNTLTLPGAQFLRLQNCIDEVRDPVIQAELAEILSSLRLSYQRLARAVEFDTGDGYLAWSDFDVLDWIEQSAAEFRSRFGEASITLRRSPGMRLARVSATRFLLDVMFGNLWANAVQASPYPCKISFDCSFRDDGRRLRLIVFDNGDGFTNEHQETAFQQAFSTKSSSRGRGLLEIADAVAQLQGTIALVEVQTGEFRICIELPSRTT